MPYQVLGDSAGAFAVTTTWTRSASARSSGAMSAILSRTARRTSAFPAAFLRAGRGPLARGALGARPVLGCHVRDPVEGRLQTVGLLGTLPPLGAELGGALLHRGPLLGAEAVGLPRGALRGHLPLPLDTRRLGADFVQPG